MTQYSLNTKSTSKQSGKLAKIFAKMNMSELPAMSENVQELISLSTSSRSAAYDLSRVVLKDYSLTNKVLQIVNSAYYSLSKPVSSISRAVTVLGFDAVREIALGIALFDDFIKSGVEKEPISKLMTQAFLSGLQAREVATKKNINVLPEEAFICSLLHRLGKIIVCIYLPGVYKKIEKKIALGKSEESASKSLLGDLTYGEIGKEVAIFWNLSDRIVNSMEPAPTAPTSSYDAEGYLHNLADFSNSFVDTVCSGGDVEALIKRYDNVFDLDLEESVAMLQKNVEASQDISDSMRYGLAKLDMQNRVLEAENPRSQKVIIAEQKKKQNQAAVRQSQDKLDELPSSDKSVNDFIRDLASNLMTDFRLDEFYGNLLEALYRGIGFDRVILAIISIQATKISIIGRYGLGLDPGSVSHFEHPLNNPNLAVSRCLKACKDMIIPPNTPHAFPDNLKYLVKNRTVYLFPVCINKKSIALIYMDRKIGRPKLDEERLKATKIFRDFAVMAIQKIREKSKL